MTVTVRLAKFDDLNTIIELLTDDALGQSREDGRGVGQYAKAFSIIESDPKSSMFVAVDLKGLVVGYSQTTIIPGLSQNGGSRCLIEDVRVSSSCRRQGIGKLLIANAIAVARDHNCVLIELFMNRQRKEARALYTKMGFSQEHDGFRLSL